MTNDAFIQCRVTPEMKTLVRALAEREETTESALVKQLLEVVLRTAAVQGFPDLGTLDKPNRDARLYVRLDPDDRALLTSRASARGMRAATYVSVLVRAHLRKITPIPKEELAALKSSISELRAIGINLNQIARALNQGKEAAPGRQDLQAMLKVAESLRDHFKALLIANEKTWEQGHAEERH
jgi:uncharacterized protein (DUF1778 family)